MAEHKKKQTLARLEQEAAKRMPIDGSGSS